MMMKANNHPRRCAKHLPRRKPSENPRLCLLSRSKLPRSRFPLQNTSTQTILDPMKMMPIKHQNLVLQTTREMRMFRFVAHG
jgi:hypothetical protein